MIVDRMIVDRLPKVKFRILTVLFFDGLNSEIIQNLCGLKDLCTTSELSSAFKGQEDTSDCPHTALRAALWVSQDQDLAGR